MHDLRQTLGALLKKHDPDGMQRRFRKLWRNWSRIVDEDIALTARPIGHRKRILILGVDDSMAMQNVTYSCPMILYQVNEYLGQAVFDKVIAELIRDRKTLDTIEKKVAPAPRIKPVRPQTLGSKRPNFEPGSAIAQCYDAYVNVFKTENDSSCGASSMTQGYHYKEDSK